MLDGGRCERQKSKPEGQELYWTEGFQLVSRMAKEGHTGKVTPVHRCAGSEGQNHADIHRMLITGSRSSTSKGPEVGASLMWSRDTREATVAGVARGGG